MSKMIDILLNFDDPAAFELLKAYRQKKKAVVHIKGQLKRLKVLDYSQEKEQIKFKVEDL